MKGKTPWNIRRFLNIRFSNQQTLQDLGIQDLPGQPGLTAQLAVWMFLATVTADGTDSVTALRTSAQASSLGAVLEVTTHLGPGGEPVRLGFPPTSASLGFHETSRRRLAHRDRDCVEPEIFMTPSQARRRRRAPGLRVSLRSALSLSRPAGISSRQTGPTVRQSLRTSPEPFQVHTGPNLLYAERIKCKPDTLNSEVDCRGDASIQVQ
eukprot:1596712-Rhodomonas_salina.1